MTDAVGVIFAIVDTSITIAVTERAKSAAKRNAKKQMAREFSAFLSTMIDQIDLAAHQMATDFALTDVEARALLFAWPVAGDPRIRPSWHAGSPSPFEYRSGNYDPEADPTMVDGLGLSLRDYGANWNGNYGCFYYWLHWLRRYTNSRAGSLDSDDVSYWIQSLPPQYEITRDVFAAIYATRSVDAADNPIVRTGTPTGETETDEPTTTTTETAPTATSNNDTALIVGGIVAVIALLLMQK